MNMKAQSAMEYLMTYGWAILIIAIVMGALFSLGVFSKASLLPQACIASSGYECQNPSLIPSGSSNTLLNVTLGQFTGTNWNSVTFYLLNSSVSSASVTCPFPSTLPSGEYASASSSLSSGGTVRVTFTIPTSLSIGSPYTGTIWAEYNGNACTQIATISIKVT